jgi:rfaE bifunctional protein nucleotidyltransferase chain/domain/rfaE bifunctional protein kinase chain/domain
VRRRQIVVLGDAVLDRDLSGRAERIAPDAPVPVLDVDDVAESPGGAGLTALLAAGPGVDVQLVAPIADDPAGARLLALLRAEVGVLPLPHAGATRTKTRLRSAGQSLLRLDAGGPGAPHDVPLAAVRSALAPADVVLVSDYGAGTTRDPGLRALLDEVAPRVPVVWDPHPRGGAPGRGAALVTPNLAEARHAAGRDGAPDELAVALRERWAARAVCVTAGAGGAYLAPAGSEPMFVPAPAVAGGDPCGAGDRFAASAALALARGAVPSEAVVAAVRDASAWVAAGGAAGYRALSPSPVTGPTGPTGPAAGETVAELVARVRAGGGRVVATGGCFDILHVGHVACLQAARRAGDALVVLLNSDASVRRLKGPGRPVIPQHERIRVLLALECVDAVVVFDEHDPRAALARLRPDVWAKGGDYGGTVLPEAELVRGWGGRVLLLPYVDGRSTTAILAAGSRPSNPSLHDQEIP